MISVPGDERKRPIFGTIFPLAIWIMGGQEMVRSNHWTRPLWPVNIGIEMNP
jgi:hypothetical protein